MKVTRDLRKSTPGELTTKLGELKKELLKFNMGSVSGGNPANPGKVKQTKKNIARILTLLQEKGGTFK